MGRAMERQNLQIHPSWLSSPPLLGGRGSWGLAFCSDKSKTWQTKGGIEKHCFIFNFKVVACKARCLIMNLKSLIVYCSGSIVIYLYVLWTTGKRLSTWRLTWHFQVDLPFRSKRLNSNKPGFIVSYTRKTVVQKPVSLCPRSGSLMEFPVVTEVMTPPIQKIPWLQLGVLGGSSQLVSIVSNPCL